MTHRSEKSAGKIIFKLAHDIIPGIDESRGKAIHVTALKTI